MNIPKFCTLMLSGALCIFTFQVKAQKHKNHTLFTAGHASAFIGGLYDAHFPYTELKKHGDFGLGAPDKLDGELIVFQGRLYQSTADGKTFEIPDTGKTAFAVVNFFKADKSLKSIQPMDKDGLYTFLDSVLTDTHAIYAIHIKGDFKVIRTRAFPPVNHKPYLPLAKMLPLQRSFTFEKIKGDLVGYRLPAHMEGPNISGYHFHFISDDKKAGGHIIDLKTGTVIVEIETLHRFTVDLPETEAFRNFDLKEDRREDVRRVENGK